MLALCMAGKKRQRLSQTISSNLLNWYDHQWRNQNWRDLPWREPPKTRADPYRVWLSEVMLQQTTVSTAAPYYRNFLSRWPRLSDVALAPLEDILHAWQGLGYYARARNLHACAREVLKKYNGQFPNSEEALRKLPGIGAYTAAAIAAIAFDQNANVIDGNVERVMSRLFLIETALPSAKSELAKLAASLVPERRPGDYAQALMDLGATVCTPRRAQCQLCPIKAQCRARIDGNPERLPLRSPRRRNHPRYGIAFWLSRSDGSVLLRRRPNKGLLGGMIEVPSTPWSEEPWMLDRAVAYAPVTAYWQRLNGVVSHHFSHFTVNFELVSASIDSDSNIDGLWVSSADFTNHALPTLTKKIIAHSSGK